MPGPGAVSRDPVSGMPLAFNDVWLGNLDSNQDKQSQSLLCYRYTIPQGMTRFAFKFNALGGNLAVASPRGKSAVGRSSTRFSPVLASADRTGGGELGAAAP